MKITKLQLKRIIKEELESVLEESISSVGIPNPKAVETGVIPVEAAVVRMLAILEEFKKHITIIEKKIGN